ncbi:MAG: hypothetical protein ACRDXX_07965 [Stackebrandtia sp.]
MSSSEPADLGVPASSPETDASRRRRRIWWIAVLAVSAVLIGGLVAPRVVDTPAGVVEEFFDAVVDKDVDRALSHVARTGFGAPYGEAAAFLHPDAIADGWELLEASHSSDTGVYNVETWVDVTIGNSETTAHGRIEVTDFGGEWKLVDPFVNVEISALPLTYMRINDRTVVTDELYGHDVAGMLVSEYQVFPGWYEFFGDLEGVVAEPEAAKFHLPPTDAIGAEPTRASLPTATFTDAVHAAAQTEVAGILDDCVEFQTPQPANCPFAVDEYFADEEELYLNEVRDVEWTIDEYPTVRLEDPGGDERDLGLNVVVDDPGLIRLSAVGEAGDEEVRIFADCGVAADPLRAALRPDGVPEVYSIGQTGGTLSFAVGVENTCRYSSHKELK